MKKFIVFALALFLAVPALSFAGSATSRWDVTIGGYIKFDMGYTDQAQGADYTWALRDSKYNFKNVDTEYGNFYSYGGETRLNFLINGPTAFGGAKTMAFLEGDFRGEQAAAGSGGTGTAAAQVGSGTFALRHAFMKIMWEKDSLTIGHTWQVWGLLPTFANVLLGWNMLGAYDKGGRQPQIMWNHDFNKNWGFTFGIIAPTKEYGVYPNMNTVNNFSQSPYPFVEGEVRWTSDGCGKIGPWQMLFGLSGFYGKEKRIYANAATLVDVDDYAIAAYNYSDKTNDAWGMAFKGFIPIIPEKKGDKGGALALSGILFATQNPSWYLGPLAVGSYNRTATLPPYIVNGSIFAADPSYATPLLTGGWGQLTYFFTNNFFASGWYGYHRYHYSNRYKNNPWNGVLYGLPVNPTMAGANTMETQEQMIFNLSYDVNPAMRFGIEYDYIKTGYAARSFSGYSKDGTLQSVRIGAWYFF